ncbi:heme NO-binding domain-containing protein [Pontibacter arcticus]|uniref:Heme NO-binding domain-containing protein n=1 Tax=Pontibacter arcticus TaxID=2080288 RepID=A0A364RCI6_9BACT|nr:heme NO-binding domain-containing protein [Pontibacter arcticus]RAU81965.1 hypothetical protein DP923_14900 [Pontibacter arcticus]
MHSAFSDNMHGSIFIFLKRFMENEYDYSTWIKILERKGINRLHETYQMNEVYPVAELFDIISEGAAITGVSNPEFQEKFGEFLVPDLLLVFKKFIDPNWKTYDMLQYISTHMHGGIKKENSLSNPPPLHVTKVGRNLIIIDYHSKRRMAGFAIGIVKGLARYFQEQDRINVLPTTDLNAERVQIKVEFSHP